MRIIIDFVAINECAPLSLELFPSTWDKILAAAQRRVEQNEAEFYTWCVYV